MSSYAIIGLGLGELAIILALLFIISIPGLVVVVLLLRRGREPEGKRGARKRAGKKRRG